MASSLRLDGIFGSGMVFQRGRDNEIWGFDDAADAVEVTLADAKNGGAVLGTYTGAVRGGRFRVTLPAREACDGITITVRGSEEIVLEDVCFGDVFLLVGQSNMELPVRRVLDASPEVVESDYPLIRHFTLTPQLIVGRPAECIAPAPWDKAVGEGVLPFSAAGFFCAKRVFEKYGVPIGLVQAAQGGSSLEAWMPREVLEQFGDYSDQIDKFIPEGALADFLAERQRLAIEWNEAITTGVEEEYSKAMPDGLRPYPVPRMIRDTELRGFCGSIWFFREVELEKDPCGEPLLYLGDLYDADRTYVNGTLAGRTEYCYPPRRYFISPALLHKGRNLIAVRLVINNRDGGFVSDHPYFLDTGAERIDLTGEWLYKIECRAADVIQGTPDETMPAGFMAQNVPTWLFTNSIQPLAGLGFAGALWYQGESNAERWQNYDRMFAAAVEAWRKELGQKLPVVCVEMPDYQDPVVENHDTSGWNTIQRYQREAPQLVPDCACVHAKDLFTPFELHPQRKDELGERLAEAVFPLIYGA